MRCISGCFYKLPPPAEKAKPPLRIVKFIVAWPCLVAVISFVIPLILSAIGWRIVVSNSGPTGPFLQLNYPVGNPVAQQSNAFIIAREESDIARLYNLDGSYRRRQLSSAEDGGAIGRTSTASDSLQAVMRQARVLTAELTEVAASSPEALSFRQLAKRALSAVGQARQTETMATALFAFRAYEEDGDAFSQTGLAEMCGLHTSLLGADGYSDYCKRMGIMVNGVQTAGACQPPATPLVFFYGPPSYNPSSIDLTVFDLPEFEAITTAINVRLAARTAPCNATCISTIAPIVMEETGCTATEFSRVFIMISTLTLELLPHWRSNEFNCSNAQLKDIEQVKGLAARIRASPSLFAYASFMNSFFDKNFNLQYQKSRFTRAFYYYGAPLDGFDTYISSSEQTDQENQFSVWWADEGLRNAYCVGGRSCTGEWDEIEPTVLISTLLIQELLGIAIADGIKAIIPVLLIFLMVWLHTGSLLIAFATLAEQILSFTAAIFFTAGVLQIKWMAFQQVLAIYIVLAIGADDVFVFMDAWKQSFYAGPEVNQSLVTRLSWVYRRAGLAMLITSLTTCASFIATAASSSMPDLQNFGIFTALVIFIDYILVMTWLCAIVVIWHNRFEMKPGLCCACCDGCKGKCCKGGCDLLCTYSNLETTTQLAVRTNPHPSEKGRFTRFFEDTFPYALIEKRPSRLVLLVVMVGVLGPMLWQVSKIAPQTNPEQFLPDDHPFQRYFDSNAEFNTSNEDTTEVISIVWGMADKPLDATGVNMLFDANYLGKPRYDADFALDSAAQLTILGTCDDLMASPIVFAKFDASTGKTSKEVMCWMMAFKEYREANGLSFPVAADAIAAILEWRGAQMAATGDFQWDRDLGYQVDGGGEVTIIWARVRASTRLNRRSRLAADELRVYYQEWEDFADGVSARSPASLGNAMQVLSGEGPNNKWIYMVLQELYVSMALIGISLGLGIAFVVLLLATRNLITTTLCIVTIGCVLVCVIGSTVAMGWQLGSVEALCFMTLTGFAVDYVVHLAHSYMEASSGSSLERAHMALQEMGISVFWGMATSFIASVILATCQLQVLSKFGLFFMLTIVLAYLWTVLFLMPLLATLGPRSDSPPKPTQGAVEMRQDQGMSEKVFTRQTPSPA